jgi:hypothetical protein
MIHGLGDPGSTTGYHRVGAMRVTSHDDGVVDRRPDEGGLQHGGQMSSLVHVGVARGVGWGTSAACGMGVDAEAARGTGRGGGAVRGTGIGAAHGILTVFGVPTNEEG